jgi:hypothetical protein
MHKKPKRRPTGNYPVGFAAPPKQHRYPKGKSGNPRGRPKDVKFMSPEDIEKILGGGVPVNHNGRTIKMPPLEVELRKLVQKALKEHDLKSIDRLLKKFKKYGLLPDAPMDDVGGVVTMPSGLPYGFSKLLITTFGAPPWSDEEIEAMRPIYEKKEAEYWAMKKEALRGIYRGMKENRK